MRQNEHGICIVAERQIGKRIMIDYAKNQNIIL